MTSLKSVPICHLLRRNFFRLLFVNALWDTVFINQNVHKQHPTSQRSSVAVPPTLPFPILFLAEKDEVINDEDDVCTVVVKRAGS
jgi:hypothetical protein